MRAENAKLLLLMKCLTTPSAKANDDIQLNCQYLAKIQTLLYSKLIGL